MSNENFETIKVSNLKIVPFNKDKKGERTIPHPLPDPVAGGIGKAHIFFINAKIGSGKSVLISNLLNYYKGYFKKIYFCSSNIEEDEDGEKIIKDSAYKGVFKFSQERLFDSFNDSDMKKILEDISETRKEPDFDESEDYFLLIVDDLSQSFSKIGSLISKTMLRVRHINLCVWIVSQRFRNIHPSTRNQISYFVSFKTQNSKEITAMAETVSKSYEDFKKILDFATIEPFSFLYIDSTKNPPIFYKNLNEQIIL